MPLLTLVHFQTSTVNKTNKMTKDMLITLNSVKTAAISYQIASKSNKECTTVKSNNKSSQNRSRIVSYNSITWPEDSNKRTSTLAVAPISPHSNLIVVQVERTINIKSTTSVAACKEFQRSKPRSLMKKWLNSNKNSWTKIPDWGMKLRGLNACLRRLNEAIGKTSKKGSN